MQENASSNDWRRLVIILASGEVGRTLEKWWKRHIEYRNRNKFSSEPLVTLQNYIKVQQEKWWILGALLSLPKIFHIVWYIVSDAQSDNILNVRVILDKHAV